MAAGNHKEKRGQKLVNGPGLLVELVLLAALGEDHTGQKGPNDSGQPDPACQGSETQHGNQGDSKGRVLDPETVQVEVQPPDCPHPDKNHQNREADGLDHDETDFGHTYLAGGRQTNHDGQNHQAQDIVDNGGPKDDASLPGGRGVEVPEHPGGDPDTGGHHRRPYKEALGPGVSEELNQPETEGEGCQDAGRGDQQGPTAHPDGLVEPGFQPDREEENDNPELGYKAVDQVEGFLGGVRVPMENLDQTSIRGADKAETVRADDRPGEELANNGRLAGALEKFAGQPGDGIDYKEVQKDSPRLVHRAPPQEVPALGL